MAITAIPEAVFLDAQAYDATSFNFNTSAFMALKRRLADGRLRLIITDITVAEVRSRIEKSVMNETATHKKYKKDSRVLRSSSRPVVQQTLVDLDPRAIVADLQDAFAAFLKKSNAEVINTSTQSIGRVFEKYFSGKPPFGSGDKKNEFPDAFVVDAISEWATKNKTDLFVISGDKLFIEASSGCARLHPKGSVTEVLDHVASDDKKLAEFIRNQLNERAAKIGSEAKTQFQDLGFFVDDENGDAEVVVTDVELVEEPEILDITGKQATVQMLFEAKYDAHLAYDDSTTGIWDSEDKQMMFMERREVTTRGEHDLYVQVEVSFDGLNARKFQVLRTDLVEPSDGFGIQTPNAASYD